MEPFDLWTKIRRHFKCILLWLEEYTMTEATCSRVILGVVGLYLVVRTLSVISFCSRIF